MWLLLHAGLSRYLRIYARRGATTSHEDLEDLASERTLDLLQRVIDGRWDPGSRHPGEVAAFLATVARNAIRDHDRGARRVPMARADDATAIASHEALSHGFDDPAHAAERHEAARMLTECVEGLAPRARRIWFMRVMLELPSVTIARHPDVGLNAPHVDVILQRARHQIRCCFEGKGWLVEALPPNAFVDLWDRLVHLVEAEGGRRETPGS